MHHQRTRQVGFLNLCQINVIYYYFPTVVPVSLNVTVGAMASFRCDYPNADSISWRINGTALRNLPSYLEGTYYINGRGTDLRITALPLYNGSMIQCWAYFPDGNLTTAAAAILKIQG